MDDDMDSSSDDDSTAQQIQLMEKKLERRLRERATEPESSSSSEDESIPDKHAMRFTVKRNDSSSSSSSSSSDSDSDSDDDSSLEDRKPEIVRVKQEKFANTKDFSTDYNPPNTVKTGQTQRPVKEFSSHSSQVSLTPPPPSANRSGRTTGTRVNNDGTRPMSIARKSIQAGGADTSPISVDSSKDSLPSVSNTVKSYSNTTAAKGGATNSVTKPINNPYKKQSITPKAVNPYSKKKQVTTTQSWYSNDTSPHNSVTPSVQSSSNKSYAITTPPKKMDSEVSPMVDVSPFAPSEIANGDFTPPVAAKISQKNAIDGCQEAAAHNGAKETAMPKHAIGSRTTTGNKATKNKIDQTTRKVDSDDYGSFFDLDSDDDEEDTQEGDQDKMGTKSTFFSSKTHTTELGESTTYSEKETARTFPKPAQSQTETMETAALEEIDGVHIVDFAAQNDERTREIEPALYAPPPFVPQPDPIVHSFNLRTRPMQGRRQTPVSQVFPSPINGLWRSKFKNFNHLQSEVVDVLAHSNDNFLVSSPTGSGKSTIFDIAMARLLLRDLQTQPNSANQRLPVISRHRKMVYVAPSKALCEERFDDWSRRLSQLNLGIEVAMITGDGEAGEGYRDLASAHFIVTTPEKFDSLSRRWTENFFLFATIKLFMVDEVHLLGDTSRGWCLETIICRIKTIQRAASNVSVSAEDLLSSSYPHTTPEAIASSMRIVAVSATLPNIQDCAALISAAECYTFDQSFRPVPLDTHIIGCGTVGKNAFQFWSNLDRRVPDLIQRFSGGKPVIVFCHSKKDTEKLADILAAANSRGIGGKSSEARRKIASSTRVHTLQRVLTYGIAYHHAGLDIQDRRLIEKGFADGTVRILCSTSTLAMGVNLPVHLVVIKGTKAWRGSGNGYQDLDAATILQMTGRAGRPGFDTSGTAVIMCDNQSRGRVEKLSNGLGPAESQLESKLVEVVNSEISQCVIFSAQSALDWIKDTLYYVRVKRCMRGNSDQVDRYLFGKLEKSIQKLREMGFVGQNSRNELHPLPASLVMAKNLVDMQSSELMTGLPADASLCQVLTAICQIEALQRPVRRYEKSKLKEAHKDIRFKLEGPPSKVKVQNPFQKAFVMLQAAIGQIYLEDYSLRQETSSMIDYASRMLSALEQYSAKGSRHGHVAVQSLKLRRSLQTSLWGEGDGVLNTLTGVGQQTTTSLKMHGIVRFLDVTKRSAEELEAASKRPPPFGSQMKKAVDKILDSALKVSASIHHGDWQLPGYCSVTLEPQNPMSMRFNSKGSGEKAVVTYTLIAYTDKPGSCLYYQEDISSPEAVKFRIPKQFGLLVVQLIASMVGLDETVELKGDDIVESNFFTKSRGVATPATAPKSGMQTKIRTSTSTITKKRAKPRESTATTTPKADSRFRAAGSKRTQESEKENRQSSINSFFSQAPPPSKQAKLGSTSFRHPTRTIDAPASQHWEGLDPARQALETRLNETLAPVGEAQIDTPMNTNWSPRRTDTANWQGPPSQVQIVSRSSQSLPASMQNRTRLPFGSQLLRSFAPTGASNAPSFSALPNEQGPYVESRPTPNQQSPYVESQQDFQAQAESLQPDSEPQAPFGGQDRSTYQGPASGMPLNPPFGSSERSLYHGMASSQVRAQRPAELSPASRSSIPAFVGGSQRRSNTKSSAKKTIEDISWGKEKRHHEKSKKRAFSSKRDNPFASFSHDPNDAEGALDTLNSQQSSTDIIPPEKLAALKRDKHITRKFSARVSRGRGNRTSQPQPMRERELLAMKAAEADQVALSRLPPGRRQASAVPFPVSANRGDQMTTGNRSVATMDFYGQSGYNQYGLQSFEQMPQGFAMNHEMQLQDSYQYEPQMESFSPVDQWGQQQDDFASQLLPPSYDDQFNDDSWDQQHDRDSWERTQEWDGAAGSSYFETANSHSFQGSHRIAPAAATINRDTGTSTHRSARAPLWNGEQQQATNQHHPTYHSNSQQEDDELAEAFFNN